MSDDVLVVEETTIEVVEVGGTTTLTEVVESIVVDVVPVIEVLEVPQDTLVVAEEVVEIVEVAGQGIQGPQGIQGAPGPAGDLKYSHNQAIASDTWVIVHNMNKYPSVVVIDSGGTEVEGSVTYNSPNQLTLSFSSGFAGDAHLN